MAARIAVEWFDVRMAEIQQSFGAWRDRPCIRDSGRIAEAKFIKKLKYACFFDEDSCGYISIKSCRFNWRRKRPGGMVAGETRCSASILSIFLSATPKSDTDFLEIVKEGTRKCFTIWWNKNRQPSWIVLIFEGAELLSLFQLDSRHAHFELETWAFEKEKKHPEWQLDISC